MVKKSAKKECPVLKDELLSIGKKHGLKGLQKMRKQKLYTYLLEQGVLGAKCKRPRPRSVSEVKTSHQKKFQPKRIGSVLAKRRSRSQ
jgi:hypothetical protein